MAGYKTPRRTNVLGLLADESDPQERFQGYQHVPVDTIARTALGPIMPLGEMAAGQRPYDPDAAVQSGVEYALKRFTGGVTNPLGAAVHADAARANLLDPMVAEQMNANDPRKLLRAGLLAPVGWDPSRPNDL